MGALRGTLSAPAASQIANSSNDNIIQQNRQSLNVENDHHFKCEL